MQRKHTFRHFDDIRRIPRVRVNERLILPETINNIVSGYVTSTYFQLEAYMEQMVELKKEVEELKRDRICLRQIDDTVAKEEVNAYLIEKKRAGVTKVSLVDLVDRLKLPVDQIEVAMEKLKSKGVKEVD